MIEFRDVSFRYGGDEKGAGVRGIDLHVKKGELLVFCGGSGCGKTTITRMLNGLIPSYYEGELDGRISIGGKDMKNAGIYDFSGKVGSVFQNPRSQFFCVEAMDEMAFACENLMFEKERTIQSIGSVCMEFNIENLVKNNLFELSGGEKQKIACASVAVMDPDIYVLDEPSSNLDIGAIEDLKKVVSRWKAEGKTVIVSEHRLYWLSDIADRFVYMEKGRIDRIFTNEEFSKMNDGERHDMGLRSFDPFVFNVESRCPPCGGFMEIEGFRFGCKRRKLVDVDRLSLPKNGIFGILGDNGAGKSSFAKVLCGLERKCRGNLVRSGGKLNAKGRLQNSYMVMQDVNHQLFTDSVMEEVLLSMEGGDEDGKRRIAEGILADFNLFDKKDMHPMSLSGGEKQRVAIASAVASSRDIVVLDEPTSGLDYENMKEVASHIRDMRESGKSVFIITHDPELLYRCCDHILFIDGGKIKWHGQLDLETATRINRDFFKRR